MNDSKALFFLGGIIIALLIAIAVILLTGGDDSPDGTVAATAAAPATSSATTAGAAAATTAPPTTAAPTTAPPTTATPTTTTTALYLQPEGYGDILAGADHNALAAAGKLTIDGWDATMGTDGYNCGWGSGAGTYNGKVTVQLFDWVGVIFAAPGVVTPMGAGIGSTPAQVIGVHGTPTQDLPGPYDPNERHLYYQVGAYGYHFSFPSASAPANGVSAGFWDKLHLAEGCL